MNNVMGKLMRRHYGITTATALLRAIDITTQVLPVLFIGATIILGILQPEHNPLQNTISELVLGTGGWFMTLLFLAFGGVYLIFSYRICVTYKGVTRAKTGAVILTVMGFCFILIAACPTEPRAAMHSLGGIIHVLAAGMVACLFPPSAYCIWKSDTGGEGKKSLRCLTQATIIAGLLLGLATFAGLILGAPWKGAAERVMALNGLVWFQAVGYHLLKYHRISLPGDIMTRGASLRLQAMMRPAITSGILSRAVPALQKHARVMRQYRR